MARKSYNPWGPVMIFVGVIMGLLFAGVMYQWNVGVSPPQQEQQAAVRGGATPTPAATAVAAPLAVKPDVVPTMTTGSATPAAAPSPAAAAGVDVAVGQRVYETACNACHPNGGQGAGPALRGPAFESKFSKDEDLSKIIRQGTKGGMPPFGASQISDQDMANLMAYIRTLK